MTRKPPVELGEYKSIRVPAPAPTSADLRLSEQLEGRDLAPRISVKWLANSEVEITTYSWVGVVRFSQLDIHVVPKLVGGAVGVLKMLEYAAGISLLKRINSDRPLPANGKDLFDLICMLLAEETKALVRDGVLRDYRPVDEAIEVVRGRIRYRDQYLRRYGQLQPLECHYDEYDSDTPDNQLIMAALSAARKGVQDLDVRASLMRLESLMVEVCEPPTVEPAWYEQVIQYGRRNTRYRPAHQLSLLVLRATALDNIYDTSAGSVSSFMLNMNTIFERFVSRLAEESLQGSDLSVERQASLRAVIQDDVTGRSYGTLRPDLVVRHGPSGRCVPIDIKYKLYDRKKVSTGDIYQLFLYAYALGADNAHRQAGLIYPAAKAESGPVLSIKPFAAPTAARILGEGLDVTAALKAIGSNDTAQLYRDVRLIIERVTGLDAAKVVVSA